MGAAVFVLEADVLGAAVFILEADVLGAAVFVLGAFFARVARLAILLPILPPLIISSK